jgi:hypothetical protein
LAYFHSRDKVGLCCQTTTENLGQAHLRPCLRGRQAGIAALAALR